jgi:hypothetical protein
MKIVTLVFLWVSVYAVCMLFSHLFYFYMRTPDAKRNTLLEAFWVLLFLTAMTALTLGIIYVYKGGSI